MKNNKAFTLVELVAVVALLGVLLMFTYSKVTDLVERKDKEMLENKKSLVINAAKEYVDNHGDIYSGNVGSKYYISIETLEDENLVPVEVDDLKKKFNYLQLIIGNTKNSYNFVKKNNLNLAACPGSNCVYVPFEGDKVIYKVGDTLTNYTKDYMEAVKKNTFYSSNNYRYYLGFILDNNSKIERMFTCGFEKGLPFCVEISDGTEYETNKKMLADLFDDCSENNSIYYCHYDMDASTSKNPTNVNSYASRVGHGHGGCYASADKLSVYCEG